MADAIVLEDVVTDCHGGYSLLLVQGKRGDGFLYEILPLLAVL